MSDYNDRMIEEFRAGNGVVSSGHGSSLVLLHSVGAKSGAPRVHPVLAIRDGESWLVAASKGGAPENPAWYHNLLAHPETELEAPASDGVDTVAVRAEEVTGDEYAAAWALFTARSRAFGQYAERAGRHIPVMRLSPR